MLVATVPQLGISVLPRSRRAAEIGTTYVYVFHSMVSTHMIYEPDGFDHYDTVCCVGPYMIDEIRRREAARTACRRRSWSSTATAGSTRSSSRAARRPSVRTASDPPVVLIAPSWGPTCIFETCGEQLVRVLLDAGYEVIARPHPMTDEEDAAARSRRSPGVRAVIRRFTLDTDIAGQESLHRSDLMVSDWSGAALEYAFGLERPGALRRRARKVNNPEYERLGIEPFEATIREQVGRVVAPDRLDQVPALVDELVGGGAEFGDQHPQDAREQHLQRRDERARSRPS